MTRRPKSRQLAYGTFGMLCDRGFSLTVFCDSCKEAAFVDLGERPELDKHGVERGCSIRRCRRSRFTSRDSTGSPRARVRRAVPVLSKCRDESRKGFDACVFAAISQ